MTKTISLLGATGSIGRQTLSVAQELGLSVAALTANRQVDLLEQQARQFRPRLAVLYDPAAAKELRGRLQGHGPVGMPQGVCRRHVLQLLEGAAEERPSRAGQQQPPDLAAIKSRQRRYQRTR